MGRRRKHSDELRRRAIDEVLERGRKLSEVAKQLVPGGMPEEGATVNSTASASSRQVPTPTPACADRLRLLSGSQRLGVPPS
jgi:hypothetical protein